MSKTGVVDETQFDPDSQYFDPKSKREAPTWDCVEVEFVEKLPRYVALAEIRADRPLAKMALLKRGMRLSVQPVTDAEYARIVQLSREPRRRHRREQAEAEAEAYAPSQRKSRSARSTGRSTPGCARASSGPCQSEPPVHDEAELVGELDPARALARIVGAVERLDAGRARRPVRAAAIAALVVEVRVRERHRGAGRRGRARARSASGSARCGTSTGPPS